MDCRPRGERSVLPLFNQARSRRGRMVDTTGVTTTLVEVVPVVSDVFGGSAASRIEVPPEEGGELGRTTRASQSPRETLPKRPIASQDDLDALVESARLLSREHWEVVTILYKTGIEVEALSRLTWRDLGDGIMVWKRKRRREEVVFRLLDADLAAAVRGFVKRPRRSTDQLDRLVKQARDASGRPSLAVVTPLSLRLTRCLTMLEEGMSEESVQRTLNLKPAVVREVARYRRYRRSDGSVADDDYSNQLSRPGI